MAIKTSEILIDDSLDALIAKLKQLEGVVETLTGALKKEEAVAAELETTTKTLNATTAQGREQIVKNAKAADDVEKAYKTYERAIADTNKEIQHYRTEANIANQIKKNEAKLAANVATSYNALSAQYSLIKIRLNAMSKAEREATEEGKALVKRSKEIHDEMKRLQEVTGNTALNVGNYKESIMEALNASDLFGNQLSFITRIQNTYKASVAAMSAVKASFTATTAGGTNALKLFRLALMGTGIGAIVVVLGTLVAAFLSTQKGIDAVNRVLVPLKVVFEGLWGAIQNISMTAIPRLVEALKNPLPALKELGDSIKENMVNTFEQVKRGGEGLIKLFSKDWKQGLLDMTIAAGEVTGFNKLIGVVAKTSKAVSENVKENYKLGESIQATRVALREEEIAFEKRRALLERTIAREKELASDQEKSTGERVAALNRSLAAVDALAKGEESIARKRVDLAKLESKVTADTAEDRLALAKLEADVIRMEAEHADERRGIIRMASGLRKQDAAERERLTKEEQAAKIKQLEADKEAALARLAAETDYTNKSLSYTQERAILRFETEESANKAILDSQLQFGMISEQQYQTHLNNLIAARAQFLEEIKKERRDAQGETNAIPSINLGKSAEKLALKRVEEIASKAAKTAQYKLQEESEKSDFSIYSMLGINDQKQQSALTSALQTVKGFLNEYVQSIEKAAQARVTASERAISAAENEYNRQVTLLAAGEANTADTAQRELARAKANQDKALEQQRKAQKTAQAIQTIEQVSSLTTATANLWKSFSGTGPVSTALALGAIALMWGSFAAAKIRASQLSKQEFAGGGWGEIGGGTHASGNDTNLGFKTKDGKQAYAQKDELFGVVRHEKARRYKGEFGRIIDQMNAGTYKMEFDRQANAARDLPLVLNVGGGSNVSTRGMETRMDRMIEQGKDRTYTDSKGRLVVKRGNRTTTYVN